jgi:hypothetical protein
MSITEVRLIHSLPGRVRFKFDAIKGNSRQAEEVQQRLSDVNGVRSVQTNPITGSVLVTYEQSALGSLEFYFSGASALGIPPSDLDPLELRAWLSKQPNGAALPAESRLGEGLRTVFSAMNTGIATMTGGVGDLRTFVPLALVFLGVRSLLLAEKVVPAWYLYFWFAFASFFMLNRNLAQNR